MAVWDFVSKLFGRARPVAPETEAVPPSPSPDLPKQKPAPLPPPVPPAADSDFLPIGRDDLLKQAQEVRRTTGWMWFGRRDLIPPVDDPRTELIDRGLVTEGFVTSEQLTEMHRAGDEWMKYANRAEFVAKEAARSGQDAVEADRAARAAVKAEKKAQAAERKRQRQESVAHRKATDIIFVGKGVSGRLNDRTSDVAKLEAVGLPILSTPADLAAALGLTIPRLRWLCFHTEAATRIHYVQFEVPKRSGGTRVLSAPHRTLATAQEWVLANILSKLPTAYAAHGFVPGRSTLTNARPHAGKDLVIGFDLADFFPSIGFARVRHVFQRLGYSGAVATLLALLCTECPRKRVIYSGTPYFVAVGPRGLPQGACTSPALSNQIARRLDLRLAGLAKKLGLTYSRYADDLTLSAGPGGRDKVGYIMARVRHIAQDEGFAINAKKTRVRRPESRQVVTGLVVNAAPAVPRDMARRLRAILHRARTEGLAAQNRDGHPHFRAWVEGMIAYIAMARPEKGARLRSMLQQVKAA